jgi:predicted Zn-ribbon and HTH transcriptional regulator
MTFGNATTNWYPVESMGGYFRLLEGTLMHCPMLVDGSPAHDEGEEVDEIEVIFDASDDDNYERCKLVGEALSALGTNKFEGSKGDSLPLACEKCGIRVGDTCEHFRTYSKCPECGFPQDSDMLCGDCMGKVD